MKTKKVKLTLQDLVELKKQADRACTCDGGNTNGCSACRAERELKRISNTRS